MMITAATFLAWAVSDVWVIRKLRQQNEQPSPFLYVEPAPILLIVIHYLIQIAGWTSPVDLLACVVWTGLFRTAINFNGRINTLTWRVISWTQRPFRDL